MPTQSTIAYLVLTSMLRRRRDQNCQTARTRYAHAAPATNAATDQAPANSQTSNPRAHVITRSISAPAMRRRAALNHKPPSHPHVNPRPRPPDNDRNDTPASQYLRSCLRHQRQACHRKWYVDEPQRIASFEHRQSRQPYSLAKRHSS